MLKDLEFEELSSEPNFAKIATGDQLADALTKQLPGPAFIKFRNQILKSNKDYRAI